MSWLKKITLGIFTIGVLGLLTLPFWFVWALPCFSEHLGLSFSSIERRGYLYLSFRDIRGDYPDFSFDAEKLDVPNPVFWIPQALVGYPEVKARGSNVVINIKDEKNTREKGDGHNKALGDVYKITQNVIKIWEGYIRFIPPTYLTGVKIQSKDNIFELDTADWEDQTLYTVGEWTTKEQSFRINVGMKPNEKATVEASFPDLDLTVKSEIKLRTPGVKAEGNFIWEGNDIFTKGVWSKESDIPDSWEVKTTQYVINPKYFNLESHETLKSDAHLEWTPEGYMAELKSYALNKSTGGDPIDIQISFAGKGKSLDISKLKLQSPWINSETESVTENKINILLNLNEVSAIPAVGIVKGLISLSNAKGDFPKINAQLEGSDLFFFQKEKGKLELNARLEWPILAIEKLHIETEQGGLIDFKTEYNIDSKSIPESKYQLSLDSEGVKAFFDGLSAETIKADGIIKGTLNNWPQEVALSGIISGKGVEMGFIKLGDVNIDWDGTLWQNEVSAKSKNDRGDWALSGTLHWRNKNCFLSIKDAYFNSNDHGKLILAENTGACASADDNFPLLEIDPLVFSTEGNKELRLSATLKDAESGHFEVAIGPKAFLILKALLVSPEDFENLSFGSFNVSGEVKEGYLYSNSKLVGTYSALDKGNYEIELIGKTGEDSWDVDVVAKETISGRADLKINASVDINENTWEKLIREKEYLNWNRVKGSVVAQKVPVEMFKPFIPKGLKDEGTIDLSINKNAGERFRGTLELKSVESMPIPTVGVIQNISSKIAFEIDKAKIESFSGEFGGVPLTIKGDVKYKGFEELLWNLKISGTDVPITRSAGIRLKGDIDLSFTSDEKDQASITGGITLKEGLVLGDISNLLNSTASASSPDSTPPYFKIEDAPYSTWKLDVSIQGNKFLRIQSPFLRTKASTQLKLSGTLGDPTIIGNVWAEGGTISFPYGVLDINRADISVTAAKPEPELKVEASGQTYGYAIKLKGSGPLDDPAIEFASTPSLESQEILLMMSVGQIPASAGGKRENNPSPIAGLGFYLGKSLLGDWGLFDTQENRFKVRFGQDIAESGKNTADVDYQINDKVSIHGEYNRYQSFNLDAKWEIYSK